MNKEIQMVCFDLDETLTTANSWVRLNLDMGLTDGEDMEMFEAYKAGTLSYGNWQNKITDLYKERGIANKQSITKSLLNFDYNSGAKEVVNYLKDKGYKLALISGAPDILVEYVAKDLGFDFYDAHNKFIFSESGEFESMVEGGDEGPAKLDMLENISKQSGIPIHNIACIGDGKNEMQIFEATGNGITFYGSPLKNTASILIDNLHGLKNVL